MILRRWVFNVCCKCEREYRPFFFGKLLGYITEGTGSLDRMFGMFLKGQCRLFRFFQSLFSAVHSAGVNAFRVWCVGTCASVWNPLAIANPQSGGFLCWWRVFGRNCRRRERVFFLAFCRMPGRRPGIVLRVIKIKHLIPRGFLRRVFSRFRIKLYLCMTYCVTEDGLKF